MLKVAQLVKGRIGGWWNPIARIKIRHTSKYPRDPFSEGRNIPRLSKDEKLYPSFPNHSPQLLIDYTCRTGRAALEKLGSVFFFCPPFSQHLQMVTHVVRLPEKKCYRVISTLNWRKDFFGEVSSEALCSVELVLGRG